jgi:outer membrane protein assembly factor BamB
LTAPVSPSSPVIGADGTVYIASQAGSIVALDGFSGAVKWTARVRVTDTANPVQIWLSPALSATSLFVGSDDGTFRAYDQATGAVQWTYVFNATLSPAAVLRSSPVLTPEGAIILGCNDFSINALDQRSGRLLWRTPTGGAVYPYAAFSATGTIYIGSSDGVFRALFPNGVVRWTVNIGSEVQAPAAVGPPPGGYIYFGDQSGRVHALEPVRGDTIWTYETRGAIVRFSLSLSLSSILPAMAGLRRDRTPLSPVRADRRPSALC